jgi:hypothetical protein
MRRRPSLGLFISLVLTFCGAQAAIAACTVPNTITNGQVADATPVMGNFNSLAACANSLAAGSTNAVQINGGSGAFAGVGPLTNGQVLVGSTGTAPVPATITAGTGINVTNGPGSITITNTGGAGGAQTLISEVVTSSSQASVSFSSIPNTYRDLIIIVRGRGTKSATSANLLLQFNGDTGANYDMQVLQGFGTGSGASESFGQTSAFVAQLSGATATANFAGNAQIRVFDYRGTTFFKNAYTPGGFQITTSGTGAAVGMFFNQWRSTAAITSVLVFLDSGAFVDGSVVSLYGSL